MSLFKKGVAGRRRLAALVLVGFSACVGACSSVVIVPSRATYDVQSRLVSFACEGAGHTPIVFLAGGSDADSVWSSVRSSLGPSELTCAFNLRDLGTSVRTSTNGPLTPQLAADALAQTLTRTGLEHCVLVAHSLGGLTARVFGRTYRDRLVGAVLLDPTVPHFIDDNPIDRAEFVGAGWDPESSKQQANAVVYWGIDVPLIILSHDPRMAVTTGAESAEDQRLWSQGQREYARLTPHGTQQDVAGATHYVQRDNPEIVVAAIRKVLHSLP